MPKMYGIWIKNKGWLRGKDVWADEDIEKTKQVAKLVGGSIRFIDPSLIDMENMFLEIERKTLWHTFKTFFKRNGKNLLSNSKIMDK